MSVPPRGTGGSDRGRTARALNDEEPAAQEDFHRGGGNVTGDAGGVTPRRTPTWSGTQPRRFETVRPPVWLSFPLLVLGVLDGFLVFSAVWTIVGDALMAIPLATLAGLGIGAVTILVGGYVWTRTTNAAVTA